VSIDRSDRQQRERSDTLSRFPLVEPRPLVVILHTLVSIIFSVSPRDLTDSLHAAEHGRRREPLVGRFAAVHREEQRDACVVGGPWHLGFSVDSADRDDATAVADSLNARYMRARIARVRSRARFASARSRTSFTSGIFYLKSLCKTTPICPVHRD